MKDSKVFCIGFQKSGTSTIGYALELLGLKVKGFSPELLEAVKSENWEEIKQVVDQFDAFQDNPWPILYEKLDQLYPGSKFILTERDVESWYGSALNHFKGTQTEMRIFIYGKGDPEGHKDAYMNRYTQHYKDVKQYFKDRPNDLLVMDLKGGDGWEKLCGFLGKQQPKRDFPHKNRKEVRTWWGTILTKIRQKFNIDFNF